MLAMSLGTDRARYVPYEIWNDWYDTARWHRIRRQQLLTAPLCKFCSAAGRVTAATVVDHVKPHHGDRNAFWLGPFQSLCVECHNGRKRGLERRGFDPTLDADGWPVDPQHPANRPRIEPSQRFGFSIPHGLKPSGIPCWLICGPPASGKSTWVAKHAKPGDAVISLDECKLAVGGRMWDTDVEVRLRALRYRDKLLRTLAQRRHGEAFVVVGAPTLAERNAWARALGVTEDHVVVLTTPAEVCIERLNRDPDRAHAAADLVIGVRRWHYQHRNGLL
jgi:5-methylcytosine-specific restriction enzyme A